MSTFNGFGRLREALEDRRALAPAALDLFCFVAVVGVFFAGTHLLGGGRGSALFPVLLGLAVALGGGCVLLFTVHLTLGLNEIRREAMLRVVREVDKDLLRRMREDFEARLAGSVP